MTILAYIFIPQSQLYQLFALNNVNVGMKLCTTLLCTIRMKTAEGLVVSDPDRMARCFCGLNVMPNYCAPSSLLTILYIYDPTLQHIAF